MRFYFYLQKLLIVDRVLSILLYISALSLSQILLYFSNKLINFYISACFRKHCIQWLNFTIIIQITNKIFIAFLPKEILLDTNTFLIFSSFHPLFYGKIYFFQFQYCQTLKFLYLFLYVVIKFYAL